MQNTKSNAREPTLNGLRVPGSSRYKTCEGTCEERECVESEDTRRCQRDHQIRGNVEAELKWDPSIDARHIGVIVNDAVVTLTGEVGHLSARCEAEEITKRVIGVRAIANEIRVTRALDGPSDSEIASGAADSLKWNITTSTLNIIPIVQNGWIRLKGRVASGFQKLAAEAAVRPLRGVQMIVNELTVGAEPSAAEIERNIIEAFRRLAIRDPNDIKVHVETPKVVLKGHVHS